MEAGQIWHILVEPPDKIYHFMCTFNVHIYQAPQLKDAMKIFSWKYSRIVLHKTYEIFHPNLPLWDNCITFSLSIHCTHKLQAPNHITAFHHHGDQSCDININLGVINRQSELIDREPSNKQLSRSYQKVCVNFAQPSWRDMLTVVPCRRQRHPFVHQLPQVKFWSFGS